MMCSITGRPSRGVMGLGLPRDRGRSRVPSPPAMITAFKRFAILPLFRVA